jgi:hypothetical protein
MSNDIIPTVIPEHVSELLGPPPVTPPNTEQRFYTLLAALAGEARPASILDWLDLWDATLARLELGTIASAQRTVVTLMKDRAMKEITRTGAFRFVPRDPYKATDRMFAKNANDVEQDEPKPDLQTACKVLAQFELPPEQAIVDVAYTLAAPVIETLQKSQHSRLTVARMSMDNIERRRDRPSRAPACIEPAQDAEFEPISGPADTRKDSTTSPAANGPRAARGCPPRALPEPSLFKECDREAL